MALEAPEAACRNLEIPPLDAYRFTVEHGVGDLLSGRIEDTGECTPGDFHPLCAILLLQPFQVFEADSLGLFDEKPDFLEFGHSYTGRLEISDRRYGADLPP